MIGNGKKRNIKFHKVLTIQLYGYLALIPFVFAFFSILENYTLVDIILFSSGLTFLLVLLLVNHLDPLVRIDDERIILYNKYNNRPVILFKKNYVSYEKINSSYIKLNFKNNNFDLKLRKTDQKKFIKILEDLN